MSAGEERGAGDAVRVVSIRGCARCHGDGHTDLEFRRLWYPFEAEGKAWEWFAFCPVNGQPILLTDTPTRERTQPGNGTADFVLLPDTGRSLVVQAQRRLDCAWRVAIMPGSGGAMWLPPDLAEEHGLQVLLSAEECRAFAAQDAEGSS